LSGFNTDKVYPVKFNVTLKYSADLVFTGELWKNIGAADTSIIIKNAKRTSSLSASGEIYIDGEEIHYASFTSLTGGGIILNSCTRGYNGTYAMPHLGVATMTQVARVYGTNTFNNIAAELTNAELNTGSAIEVDGNALGEDFEVGAVQVIISDIEPVVFSNANGIEYTTYPIAISDFRLETSHKLKANILLADTDTTTTVEDTRGLRAKLGERTFKQTYENSRLLYDQASINRLGKNLLVEYTKNNTRAKLVEMIHPDWDIGMTINIVDAANNINRNYFVERIGSDNGKLSLDVAYYP